MRPLNKPRWELDTSCNPPSFLPAGIDKTGWKDITTFGALFRVYITPDGTIHDGAVYHKRYMEVLNASDT